MIAGVSYSVFNGEEHLLHSLRNLRPCVDYVNIVVQRISNQGKKATQDLDSVLHDAFRERLFDELHEYETDLDVTPPINHIRKRSIGLEMAKKAGATHFMTVDTDEYYVK